MLHQFNQNSFGHRSLFTRAGIDYRINDKHSIGLSGFGMRGTGSGTTNFSYTLTDWASDTIIRDYTRENNSSNRRPGVNISLDYKWDIDTNGSNLISSLTYSNFNMKSDETYLQQERNAEDTTAHMIRYHQGQNKQWQYKLDYTQKFSENDRLEAGWQSTIQDRFGPNSAKDYLKNQPLHSYYNEFKYDEQIHAAYVTYGSRIKNLSLQGGLRTEYFWRHPINETKDNTGQTQRVDYGAKGEWQFFPSFFASYTLPENNEVQLNASRRVSRPRGRQINPFRNYSDSTNISYGNLELSLNTLQ